MKKGDQVTVTNPLHAYCGRTGTVVDIGADDEGDFIFVEIMDKNGKLGDDIMFEPSDIEVVNLPTIVEKNGKYYMTGLGL